MRASTKWYQYLICSMLEASCSFYIRGSIFCISFRNSSSWWAQPIELWYNSIRTLWICCNCKETKKKANNLFWLYCQSKGIVHACRYTGLVSKCFVLGTVIICSVMFASKPVLNALNGSRRKSRGCPGRVAWFTNKRLKFCRATESNKVNVHDVVYFSCR